MALLQPLPSPPAETGVGSRTFGVCGAPRHMVQRDVTAAAGGGTTPVPRGQSSGRQHGSG